jgi:hypothetical protein
MSNMTWGVHLAGTRGMLTWNDLTGLPLVLSLSIYLYLHLIWNLSRESYAIGVTTICTDRRWLLCRMSLTSTKLFLGSSHHFVSFLPAPPHLVLSLELPWKYCKLPCDEYIGHESHTMTQIEAWDFGRCDVVLTIATKEKLIMNKLI